MVNGEKILISPTSFGECGSEPLELLKRSGLAIIRNTLGRRLTEEEVIRMGSGCVGIIAGVEPLNSKVLECLPELKCISRLGVGLENVDLQAAKRRGITVKTTPDGPTRSVAELTVGFILSLLRRIPQANENFHREVWKKETGHLLHQKTVGIVGLGRIGKLVVELLQPFGCRLVGADPYPDSVWFKKLHIELMPLETLLRESEIITVHASHPIASGSLIGENELSWVRPGAWVLNLSRGDVINESALYKHLKSGHLAGAALDVFAEEPYRGPLRELSNVIGTPHLGSYAKEAKLEMEIESVRNLIETLKAL